MKKIILLHSAVAVPVLFLFWLLAYRNTLWWMEGMSFFSTLPDFAVLQARLPSGLLKYAASYLLQFYHSAVAGALLQTLYGWIVMVCADVVVWRVVRRASLSWISFVPVGIFVSLQCRYNDGVGSMVWALAAIAAAMVAVCVTRRPEHYDTGLDRRSLLRIVAVPLVLLAAGGAVSLSILENRVPRMISLLESPEQHEEDNILTCATSDEPLLMDMACLWDARPDNRMCADILLCGLLASRQMDKFAMLFSRIYASAYSDSDVLPRYYEEALLVLARQNPDILKRYSFSSFRTEAFDKFAALMDAGRYDDARAAYPDSFWSYLYAAM